MSELTDVLSGLNRDLVALGHYHRRTAEEAYPGLRGEIPDMTLDEYDKRMATCDHEMAITEGIELARQVVLAARKAASQEEVTS